MKLGDGFLNFLNVVGRLNMCRRVFESERVEVHFFQFGKCSFFHIFAIRSDKNVDITWKAATFSPSLQTKWEFIRIFWEQKLLPIVPAGSDDEGDGFVGDLRGKGIDDWLDCSAGSEEVSEESSGEKVDLHVDYRKDDDKFCFLTKQ